MTELKCVSIFQDLLTLEIQLNGWGGYTPKKKLTAGYPKMMGLGKAASGVFYMAMFGIYVRFPGSRFNLQKKIGQ